MRFFITGISRGLGKAIAEECLISGHEVWGISRSSPRGLNQRIRHTRCDLSSEKDIKNAHTEIKKAGFAPDIVILNAATMKDDFSDAIDLTAFEDAFNVNVLGHIRFLSLFLSDIVAERRPAVFLNISSISAFRAILRHKIAYPATKAALDMAFESLRLQSKEKGIRFITINLGPLAEHKKIPFLTATYAEASKKIVNLTSAKGIFAKRNLFSYPLLPCFLYRLSGIIPDGILKILMKTT